jgi:hypothetical protein
MKKKEMNDFQCSSFARQKNFSAPYIPAVIRIGMPAFLPDAYIFTRPLIC